jgi:hypothetical protein
MILLWLTMAKLSLRRSVHTLQIFPLSGQHQGDQSLPLSLASGLGRLEVKGLSGGVWRIGQIRQSVVIVCPFLDGLFAFEFVLLGRRSVVPPVCISTPRLSRTAVFRQTPEVHRVVPSLLDKMIRQSRQRGMNQSDHVTFLLSYN